MNLSTLADLPLNNPTDDNVINVLINGAAHAYSNQDSPPSITARMLWPQQVPDLSLIPAAPTPQDLKSSGADTAAIGASPARRRRRHHLLVEIV